jgi:hypothetical protein
MWPILFAAKGHLYLVRGPNQPDVLGAALSGDPIPLRQVP